MERAGTEIGDEEEEEDYMGVEFEKKYKRHEELLNNFSEAETLDDAFKWMNRIDKFEQKHLKLPLEYRVTGELMNRLKEATGKDRFTLIQKLNRAVRMVEWKEAYDPNNPANYGLIQHEKGAGMDDDDNENFSDTKDKDDVLLKKLNAIDKKLEENLAELDQTFGKKGKVLEEDIRDLAEERNALTEKKRRPLYRKGTVKVGPMLMSADIILEDSRWYLEDILYPNHIGWRC
ncbi:hypothetical protein NE237_027799 [Protea cynaroides]|uniref:Uncharacterized protein n=1 Tax=Protea cynaroides TaxID=273540 RepID=A0A9Q0GS17_9MAGN|nr:hypothetical protein NE237_027799 [Protea cynaroides]